MNREIKFRAVDTVNNEIIYPDGNGYFHSIRSSFVLCGLGKSYDLDNGTEIEGFIFEQYTGLKDKKGVKIYEGDIVYLAGYGLYEVEYPFIDLFEAKWENDIGEIKGNIHENKDLL